MINSAIACVIAQSSSKDVYQTSNAVLAARDLAKKGGMSFVAYLLEMALIEACNFETKVSGAEAMKAEQRASCREGEDA